MTSFFPVSSKSFSAKANLLLQDVSNKFNIKNCTFGARDDAARTYGSSGDRFFAAIWIIMYTNKCLMDQESLTQEKHLNDFPFRLNKELRCALHQGRDPKVRDIFLKAGRMINKALEIMKPKLYPTLYRGVKKFLFADEAYFIESGFFSATEDCDVALSFAEGQILLVVESMHGVKINDVVRPMYPREEEVLGLHGSTFKIIKTVDDPDEIRQAYPTNTPSKVIHVKQVKSWRNYLLVKKYRGWKQSAMTETKSFCNPY